MSSVYENEKVFTDTQPGDQVEVRVRTLAADGRVSDWSLPKIITTGDRTPPSDPVNFNLSPGVQGCLLTWDFPQEPDYKYTEVFRKTVNAGVLGFYERLVSSITGDSFRLCGTFRAEEAFINGDIDAQYCFKIRHIDNSNNASNFSSVLCATPRKIKPVDVHQDPTDDQIYIKPKEGIPNADLLFSYEDGYGQIISTNGTDFYYGLRADLANLDTAIAFNSDDIDLINDDITSLNSDLLATNQAVTNNSDDIDTLTTGLNTANTNIANNSTDIGALNTGLNTANTNISNNASNIATNTGNINTLNNGLNTANTNIANNTSAIGTLNIGLSAANTNISNNSGRLDSAESRLTALESKIALAISEFSIATTGTLEGYYTLTSNANGMKSQAFVIDVNSQGLAELLEDDFIVREGQVITGVTGEIVNQNP